MESFGSSEALSKKALSAEELNKQLEKLVTEDKANDEQIFDWVEVRAPWPLSSQQPWASPCQAVLHARLRGVASHPGASGNMERGGPSGFGTTAFMSARGRRCCLLPCPVPVEGGLECSLARGFLPWGWLRPLNVCCWFQANLDESQMSSPTFLRALMTAVCKAAIIGE